MERCLLLAAAFGLSISLGVNPVCAEDQELEDLLALDLEALTTVSVASKKAETQAHAPSVIEVMTAEEIRRYGAVNLQDLFDRMTSLQSYPSHFMNDNGFSIRGQSNQHYSGRILVLINGRPFRESLSRGVYLPLFSMFPISSIQQIEVIRGPGSVLYGSNAFSGVINIITQKPSAGAEDKAPGKGAAAMTYGRHNHQGLEANYAHLSDKWSFYGAAKALRTKGWETDYVAENGPGQFSNKKDGYGLFTQLSYQRLVLEAAYVRDNHSHLGAVNLVPASQQPTERGFANLAYEQPLPADWLLEFDVTANMLDYDTDNVANDQLIEMAGRGPLAEWGDLLIGATYDHQDGYYNSGGPYQIDFYELYSQIEYLPKDWFKLVAGVQYNNPERSTEDLSPRLAANFFLSQYWTLKALYGKAFRSPSAFELFIFAPGLVVGDPGLEPEKVLTRELQILYERPSLSSALTYYHSKNIDQIGPVFDPSSLGLVVANLDSINSEGLEFEGQISLNNGLGFQGSLTWQDNRSNENNAGTTFSPNFMAKFGVDYQSTTGWSLGFFDSYFGSPKKIREVNPNVLEVNKAAEAYHWLTINVDLDLNQLLRLQRQSPLNLLLFVENLTGEEVYYPEFNRRVVNSVPYHAGGPAWFVQLNVGF